MTLSSVNDKECMTQPMQVVQHNTVFVNYSSVIVTSGLSNMNDLIVVKSSFLNLFI